MEIPSEIPPELARQLFAQGAFLIIAGVPEGTEFGIDLCSYSVGERFHGVKMIPPGPHYVYTASQGLYGDSSSRIGFIHYFNTQEIVIREWDNEKEELRIRTKGDRDDEIARIRENLKELDGYLAPYDFESIVKWKNLTSHLTDSTINRCLPECGLIRPSVEFESCSNEDRPKELPERYPKHLTPHEISLAHMDGFDAIDQLFVKFHDFNQLLDEIQFAFVVYLAGYSTDALAHWRRILGLFANSETSVKKNNKFYREYLTMLQYQLPELPEELMEPTPRNTVYKDARNLIRNCTLGGLSNEANYFIANLKNDMCWTFDDLLAEDPDDLPVIVEN